MEDSDYDNVEYEEAGGLGLTEIHTKIIPIRSYSQPNKSNRNIFKDSFPEKDFNQLRNQFSRNEINTVSNSSEKNTKQNYLKSQTLKDTTKGRITRTYLRTSPTMAKPRGIFISKAKLKCNYQDSAGRRSTENTLKLLSIETEENLYTENCIKTSSPSSLHGDKLNFSLSGDDFIEKRLELDRRSSKIERGSDLYKPIKDKRNDQTKGFLSWLGGFIGCGERN